MAPGERTASPSPKAYVKLQTPHKFFKVGRVFEVDQGLIYVVVREGYSSSTCCELQFLGQNDVNYNLPNIGTLCLPDSLSRSPTDNQYQLVLECSPDEVSPLYYFDCSEWLLLSHQYQVYKIGRVDRKSIKRLEAMFAASSTPSDAITATLDITKVETYSSQMPALFSGISSTNETSGPEETSYSITNNPNMDHDSKTTGPTAWSTLGYNTEGRHSDKAALYRPELKGDEETSSTTINPNMDYRSKMTSSTTWNTWGYNTKGRHSADTVSYRPKLKGEEETPQGNSTALTRGTNAKLSPQYTNITAVYNEEFKSSLEKSYKTHRSKDFKRGSVFKVLWTEPQGEVKPHQSETRSSSDVTSHSKYGEIAYTSIRRFIIVKSYEGHSTCLPILTYSNQGVAKPGVKAAHHAVIYSSKRPPSKLSGEPELLNAPIQIEMVFAGDKLVPESRLNYAKVYTVEHNVKVHFIGRVHKDSISTFKEDFGRIQDSFLADDSSDPSDRDDTALSEDDTTAEDNVGYCAISKHKQHGYQGWGGKTYSY